MAGAIAGRLGIRDDTRFAVGLDLAQLAVEAGIVDRKKRYDGPWTLPLTDEAIAALCDLEKKESWPWPATGLHAAKIIGSIDTQQGTRQSEEAFAPLSGTAPLLAAERIRETVWRIDEGMLRDAGEWLQGAIDAWPRASSALPEGAEGGL